MSQPETIESGADELLAIRCQLGERAAFEELAAGWGPRLKAYAGRVVANRTDVDDLVQDIWLRVLRGLPGLRDPARFRSWFFGIAHRALIDRLRQQYASRIDEDAQAEELGAVDPDFDRDIDRRLIEAGLGSLSVPDREAISLFYLEQLTLAEIADSLDVPVGTVKSRLHRARRSLRQYLHLMGERS